MDIPFIKLLLRKDSCMDNLKTLINTILSFRDERDWQQFHDSKNLALAISIEAAELNELFLWKNGEESELVDKSKIKEELADIFAFTILLAEKHGLDLIQITKEKFEQNALKYPVDKAKGTSKKYDQL
jgi:NTP pyrophosphatase (non-canonical NTP hydrolase)